MGMRVVDFHTHAYPDALCGKTVGESAARTKLTLVAAHLGAWRDRELAAEYLPGERLFVDIAFSLHVMSRDNARELILRFPKDRLLFGTDSPWAGQASTIGLGEEMERAILSENARKLLGG
jgi:predicted TIM-barrel fold metal-dependent hydrolase